MLTQLHAHHIRIPLKKPIQHASHTRHETDNVLVACHLADGIVGYGEGVPRDYVTGETITSALQTLQKTNFESLQKPVQSFAEAIERIEHFRLYSPPGDDRQIASNAVRCALELAYLDAMGQHFQQPLSQITSLLAPEIHEPRARVQYSVAITSATGAKLAFQAVTRRWFGFRQCKVKVGIAGQDDVQRLRTIRRYMGPAVELRIDANEAWTVENARQKWEELAPVGLAWVEQPVSHEAIGELAKVRNQWKMPVMLDESLCGMEDARRCVSDGWGDLFNLRLSKCGGFLRTLRLAQYAHQHGIGLQLGCQVGETGILSAAGRHFATSVTGLRALEGSFDSWLVKESLTTQNMTFGRGGHAAALVRPGLGVTVSTEALARVSHDKVVLLG